MYTVSVEYVCLESSHVLQYWQIFSVDLNRCLLTPSVHHALQIVKALHSNKPFNYYKPYILSDCIDPENNYNNKRCRNVQHLSLEKCGHVSVGKYVEVYTSFGVNLHVCYTL